MNLNTTRLVYGDYLGTTCFNFMNNLHKIVSHLTEALIFFSPEKEKKPCEFLLIFNTSSIIDIERSTNLCAQKEGHLKKLFKIMKNKCVPIFIPFRQQPTGFLCLVHCKDLGLHVL